MRLIFAFTTILVAVLALPTKLPNLIEPSELALVLNEEDFEDYLDAWLEIQQQKYANETQSDLRSGCSIRVNGDLGQPQPVYIHRNNYLTPRGNSGRIQLNTGEQVTIACTGSGRTIRHPNIARNVNTATATCVNNAIISGPGWLNGNGQFKQLTCSSHSLPEAARTSERCFNNNFVIRVGYIVNNVFYPLYWSCFDQRRLEVLYVWYDQRPTNAVHQTGVDRPNWSAGPFFPGVNVNNRYTQAQQKNTIAGYVGNSLANKYITNTQFLSRGHLAAKSDFVFAVGQRATFYFINAAPQWQPFNAGNWNSLEINLKNRISRAGYNTVIYTGTFGVTQLRNANNRLVDIYLHRDNNNNEQIPVPLYFYKVAYDASRRLGTAFIGINNPYYTLAEARSRQFCTDRCRNNAAFNWIGWQPDRVDIGYSFCCTIADFRKVVKHLPNFSVNGLLT